MKKVQLTPEGEILLRHVEPAMNLIRRGEAQIMEAHALGGGQLHVLFDKNDEAEAYLVDYDAEKDVAILRLADATDKRSSLQMRVPSEDSLGSEAYAVGYPAAADLTVTAVNSFSQKDATVTTGSISRLPDRERHRAESDPDRRRSGGRQLRRSPH